MSGALTYNVDVIILTVSIYLETMSPDMLYIWFVFMFFFKPFCQTLSQNHEGMTQTKCGK